MKADGTPAHLPGRIASGLLAAACAVSVASGFFDGQLARGDLAPAEVGFQVLLLGLTGVLGGIATAVALARPVAGRAAAAS